MALGIHAAGFKHLGLVEYDAFAAETLRENSRRVLDLNPDLVLHRDARSVDYAAYAGIVDLLSGGPPCQPFSTAGRSRGHADDRNMFPTMLDAVAEIMPRAILVENVKGLRRDKFRDYFDYILWRLRFPLHRPRDGEDWGSHYARLRRTMEADFGDDEQYAVTWQAVDTADFGVPQRRERVIFSAFRRDLGIEPSRLEATHSKEALLWDQWITGQYWERHGVPSNDYLGMQDKSFLSRLRVQLLPTDNRVPWRTVRDAINDLPAPVPRGTRETVSNHVQHPGARVYPCHVGSFLDWPAKALKAGTHGTPGGENMLLDPFDDSVRYFTTREAARLHTFPDAWHFHGTWGACIRQLGNAVPVELARLFAEEIYGRLLGTSYALDREIKHEHIHGRRHAASGDLNGPG